MEVRKIWKQLDYILDIKNFDTSTPKVGNYGLNTVLLDQLNHETVTFGARPYAYNDFSESTDTIPTRYRGFKTSETMDFMKCEPDTLIVTNNVYNLQNMSYFEIAWLENEVPVNELDPNDDATPLTQNLNKKFYQKLYYGRADDEKSCGAAGCKINLPNTNEFLTASTTLLSYQTIDVINKKALVREQEELLGMIEIILVVGHDMIHF